MNITSFLIEAHIVREREGNIEFLLLKRAPKEIYPGLWQMVTGKIRKEEKAYETALREIQEETSLNPISFWVVPYTNSFYSHEKNEMCLVPVFVVQVGCDAQVILSDEHVEHKWVDKDDAKQMLAWYGQRKAVEIIYDYLTNEKSTLEFVKLSVE